MATGRDVVALIEEIAPGLWQRIGIIAVGKLATPRKKWGEYY
ncbi:hypothetical protein N752_16360 [Desulforamulus aquiferis]|nr:hypothetical protein N752_16360 [Desulforamulus aquiferis]